MENIKREYSAMLSELSKNGIYLGIGDLTKVTGLNLSDEQIKILCQVKQTQHLKIIKNCIIYFVIMSSISIIGGIVVYFLSLGLNLPK